MVRGSGRCAGAWATTVATSARVTAQADSSRIMARIILPPQVSGIRFQGWSRCQANRCQADTLTTPDTRYLIPLGLADDAEGDELLRGFPGRTFHGDFDYVFTGWNRGETHVDLVRAARARRGDRNVRELLTAVVEQRRRRRRHFVAGSIAVEPDQQPHRARELAIRRRHRGGIAREALELAR